MRKLQNLALAARTEKEGRAACGYGIYTGIGKSKYYLFYNQSTNCSTVNNYYDGTVSNPSDPDPNPQPGEVSQPLGAAWTVILPSGVTINRTPNGTGDPKTRRNSTYFQPPDPTTYIAGNSDPNSSNEPTYRIFTLTGANGTYAKTVTIYLSGRIEIQQ